jgi:hypothetical protein
MDPNIRSWRCARQHRDALNQAVSGAEKTWDRRVLRAPLEFHGFQCPGVFPALLPKHDSCESAVW